jgi:hypothetical protein
MTSKQNNVNVLAGCVPNVCSQTMQEAIVHIFPTSFTNETFQRETEIRNHVEQLIRDGAIMSLYGLGNFFSTREDSYFGVSLNDDYYIDPNA